MIEYTIRQLQSDDPVQRRATIVALGNSRDPDALRLLAAVYRRDPDPALRELALKAGQFIQQINAKDDAVPGAPIPAGEADISPRDRELARGYLNSATDFHMAGDKARAVENLGKALSLDPALINEQFVSNLVMTTTGMTVAQAVPALTHPDRRAELIERMGGKRKLKGGQQHGVAAHTATWDNVAKDFGVYWLAATMSVIAILIFTLNLIQDMFTSMDLYATGAVAEDIDVLLGASIVGVLISAVFFGIYQVISLALQGVFIHLAATAVLGGDGTLVYLYRRLVPFQTLIILIVALVLLALSLVGDFSALLFMIGLAATVGSFYVTYLLSKLIGEVYAFGAWSGCGAIVLGSIIQGFVFAIGNYAILGLIGALLGAAS